MLFNLLEFLLLFLPASLISFCFWRASEVYAWCSSGPTCSGLSLSNPDVVQIACTMLGRVELVQRRDSIANVIAIPIHGALSLT